MKKNIIMSNPVYLSIIALIASYTILLLLGLGAFTNLSKYAFVAVVIIIIFSISTNRELTENYKISKIEFIFYIWFGLFNLLYVFNITDFTLNNILAVFFNFVSFFLVLIFSKIYINNNSKKFASYIAVISMIIVVILGYLVNYNPNAISAYVFFVSFFVFYYYLDLKMTKNFLGYLKIGTFLMILLITLINFGSRNFVTCLILGILTYMIWPYLIKSKLISNLYFFILLAIIGIYTFVYPQLKSLLPNIDKIEFWVQQYTGKRLFSGREVLWSTLIEVIKVKPLFGYGANATPNMFLNTTLSAHNLYLQIALQVGLVGLVIFVIMLFYIWKQMLLIKDSQRLFGVFFVCIIASQANEVILLQNNFNLGMLQWIIIGLGINQFRNIKVGVNDY